MSIYTNNQAEVDISIHVPRVEDDTQESKKKRKIDISIHVPRVEDDVNNYFIADVREGFQSTSPVWRTTRSCHTAKVRAHYFNPRPPCGGRRTSHGLFATVSIFQSTSPVWRTTAVMTTILRSFTDFNPRPPCGGRQVRKIRRAGLRVISIHVPRVEDDKMGQFSWYFADKFQSTSPVWRTTLRHLRERRHCRYFNPRPPCGGRLGLFHPPSRDVQISIHVPRVEDDKRKKYIYTIEL